MSCMRAEGCTLNPLKFELNCKTATVATILTAIAAIVAVGGVLAILASQGVNIGALNAIMGKVGMIGGSVAAGVGGTLLLATISWLLLKCRSSAGRRVVNSERFAEVFCSHKALNRKGTTTFVTLSQQTHRISYTTKATLGDVLALYANDYTRHHNPKQLRLVYASCDLTTKFPLHKPWHEIVSESTITGPVTAINSARF